MQVCGWGHQAKGKAEHKKHDHDLWSGLVYTRKEESRHFTWAILLAQSCNARQANGLDQRRGLIGFSGRSQQIFPANWAQTTGRTCVDSILMEIGTCVPAATGFLDQSDLDWKVFLFYICMERKRTDLPWETVWLHLFLSTKNSAGQWFDTAGLDGCLELDVTFPMEPARPYHACVLASCSWRMVNDRDV